MYDENGFYALTRSLYHVGVFTYHNSQPFLLINIMNFMKKCLGRMYVREGVKNATFYGTCSISGGGGFNFFQTKSKTYSACP